jgi:hypothetical protein
VCGGVWWWLVVVYGGVRDIEKYIYDEYNKYNCEKYNIQR